MLCVVGELGQYCRTRISRHRAPQSLSKTPFPLPWGTERMQLLVFRWLAVCGSSASRVKASDFESGQGA